MKLRPDEPWNGVEGVEVGAAVLRDLPRGDLLLGYQQKAVSRLLAGVSLLAIEKSRRIGLTWGLASYATLRAAARASAGGMDVWYMGYDQEMAREFIDTCAMWAGCYDAAAEAVDEELLDDGKDGKFPAFRIRFASGFKIVALPSVPRALRGKQGLVIIDEAAFHNDLAEVLKAALAFLMWGGQVVVISTHDGQTNPFNLLLDEIRAGNRKGEVMTITLADALDQGLYERIALAAQVKGRPLQLDKADWVKDIRDTYGDDAEEELDCIPKAGAGSWLDLVSLAACEHAEAGKPELYSGGLVYIGRDVARRRDGQIIHAFELVGDVLWMRERWVARGATFAVQDAAMGAMINRYRTAAVWIDQTGMGEKVVEDAILDYGSRVHGELLTGPNRLDLATSFKDRVDRCGIRIPPDPALRSDYRSIKKQGGLSGAVRIVDDQGTHADEFWATSLACRAADSPYQAMTYTAARADQLSRREREDLPNPHGRARFGLQRGIW